MPTFAQALARSVLVFDGAMGTEIYRHHVFTNRSFDDLCLSDPKLIQEIHQAVLRRRGRRADDQHLRRQSRWRWPSTAWPRRPTRSIAPGPGWRGRWRPQADRAVFVAGSIGPLPSQPQHEDALADMIVRQADGPAGRRRRFHHLRDAAHPPGGGALGGGHAAVARRALRAFAGRRGAMRIGLGGADRADAGAACPATCPRRWPGE